MKKHSQSTSFGPIAKLYQKYRRTYDPKLYHLLFSLLPKKELTILDVGCGTGKSTEPLFKKSTKQKISVIGVDPDEAMLHEARLSAKKKKLAIRYVQGTAEKLPFESNTFDAVISGAAFHWFGNKRAMITIKSSLKERGVFFIFWTQYAESDKPAIGAKLYGKYHWKGIPKSFRGQEFVSKLLSKAGFKKVQKATIPFIEKKTIPEIIGLLKTNSSYALMLPSTKKKFVKEMTQAYRSALVKKKYDVNTMELRVCYGFKLTD